MKANNKKMCRHWQSLHNSREFRAPNAEQRWGSNPERFLAAEGSKVARQIKTERLEIVLAERKL